MTKRDRDALRALIGFFLLLGMAYEVSPLLMTLHGIAWWGAMVVLYVTAGPKLDYWFRGGHARQGIAAGTDQSDAP
jgi:hypothetical protein